MGWEGFFLPPWRFFFTLRKSFTLLSAPLSLEPSTCVYPNHSVTLFLLRTEVQDSDFLFQSKILTRLTAKFCLREELTTMEWMTMIKNACFSVPILYASATSRKTITFSEMPSRTYFMSNTNASRSSFLIWVISDMILQRYTWEIGEHSLYTLRLSRFSGILYFGYPLCHIRNTLDRLPQILSESDVWNKIWQCDSFARHA